MHELYEKIKDFSLEDALKFEKNDRQYLALKKLYDNTGKYNFSGYLVLIICNAIICYQLSGKGEDYWEEFSDYFSQREIRLISIIEDLVNFLKQSRNNKRFIETKIARLYKLEDFVRKFDISYKSYTENMLFLRDELASIMGQKIDSKTIVFGVKMFGYGLKNNYYFVDYPFDISIPIDSRLINLFEIYKGDYNDIKKFYSDLSIEMKMSPLNLDSIVWNLYDKLAK